MEDESALLLFDFSINSRVAKADVIKKNDMEKEKLGNFPISFITFGHNRVKLQLVTSAQYLHMLQIKSQSTMRF